MWGKNVNAPLMQAILDYGDDDDFGNYHHDDDASYSFNFGDQQV